MSEPTTEAGRYTLDRLEDVPESGYRSWREHILAIEAEARASERDRIAQENAERLLAIPAIRAIVERLADDLRAILAEPVR
ncbi:MAG: hypothetical protein V4510_12535 [bacterium]